MPPSHRLIKFARTLHLYIGVFTAPALLFFAITGGLQTFSLHEASRDGTYKPPAWLASMAQLHKKQTTVLPQHRPRAAGAARAADGPAPRVAADGLRAVPVQAGSAAARPKKNLLPMKLFFALVSLSLLLSTLTGLYMAWRFSRRPRLIGGLLLAGVVVPVLLSLL